MKRIIILILTLCLVSVMFSCSNPSEKENDKEKESQQTELTILDEDIVSGYARYDVTTPLKRLTEGYGAQFDTLLLEKYNNFATDWDVYKEAVKTSNLQAVRIRFYPEMYERKNDNDDPDNFDYDSKNVDFNSIEMGYLYTLLDLMEENHVNVDLSWYGCRATFESEDGLVKGSWLGGTYGSDGINGWMVAPSSKYVSDPAGEYAESVAACLNYLINFKGYTCLYEYSIFPEPEGVISDLNLYGSIASKIKDNLEKYGIKDKIKFSGPADYGNSAENLENKYLKRFTYDKVDSSVYCFHGETSVSGATREPSPNSAMYEFAKQHVDVCEKYDVSWGVAESGTSNFITAITNADTEVYDRAITMARVLINFTNAGCTNIKYFIFADCSYDGSINEEGLFRFTKSTYKDSAIDYQAKPIWYAWSLIMRYTDISSQIFPITNDYSDGKDGDVCITSYRLPDGSWTYLMANIGKQKRVAICNGRADRPSEMKLFKLTGGSTPSGEEAVLKIIDSSETVNCANGICYVTIPSNGIVLLSNKK